MIFAPFLVAEYAKKKSSRWRTEWRPDRDLNPGRSLDKAA
jgi:hypothetical protein